MMEQDTNVDDLNLTIPLIPINEFELYDLESESDDPIIVALNNKINKYIIQFLKDDPPDLVNAVRYYFSDEEVNYIIHQQLPVLN